VVQGRFGERDVEWDEVWDEVAWLEYWQGWVMVSCIVLYCALVCDKSEVEDESLGYIGGWVGRGYV
jgi:hypothetical protein